MRHVLMLAKAFRARSCEIALRNNRRVSRSHIAPVTGEVHSIAELAHSTTRMRALLRLGSPETHRVACALRVSIEPQADDCSWWLHLNRRLHSCERPMSHQQQFDDY